MNKPSEKNIELYVLDPSALTEKQISEIESWIERDEEVRSLYEWLQMFYKKLDKIESIQVRQENYSPVITLEPSEKSSSYSKYAFVLAAQTLPLAQKKKPLETIRTFVSDEHKTLLRVLYNNSKKQFHLHVISELIQDDDIVLIDIPYKEELTLVSEPGGTFLIQDDRIEKGTVQNWRSCKLHLPISKITVFTDFEQNMINFDTIESNIDREKLELNRKENELKIKFAPSIDIIPEMVVIANEEGSSMVAVEDGEVSLTMDYFSSASTTLFFYI